MCIEWHRQMYMCIYSLWNIVRNVSVTHIHVLARLPYTSFFIWLTDRQSSSGLQTDNLTHTRIRKWHLGYVFNATQLTLISVVSICYCIMTGLLSEETSTGNESWIMGTSRWNAAGKRNFNMDIKIPNTEASNLNMHSRQGMNIVNKVTYWRHLSLAHQTNNKYGNIHDRWN